MHLDYDELQPLILVCSSWKTLIEELLYLETIPISEGRFREATVVFREFHIYRTACKDMISLNYPSGKINNNIWRLSEPSFIEFLYKLYWITHTDIFYRTHEEPVKAMWGAILAMTESNISVDDFSKRELEDEFVNLL